MIERYIFGKGGGEARAREIEGEGENLSVGMKDTARKREGETGIETRRKRERSSVCVNVTHKKEK